MPCLVLGRKAHVFYEVRFFEKVVLSLVVFWILVKKQANKNPFCPPFCQNFAQITNYIYLTSKPHFFQNRTNNFTKILQFVLTMVPTLT